MRFFIAALLCALSYAQTDSCDDLRDMVRECGDGYRQATVAEAAACTDVLCGNAENGIGQWAILDLADGRFEGPGYGCTISNNQYGTEHKLCISSPTESEEEVSLVMEVTGATEGNKHKICNSTANALSGFCSYVSLWAPSTTGNVSTHTESRRRRSLQSTSVYVDIAVADAEAARATVEADGFLSSLQQSMPAGVTVSSVSASTGDPEVPAYESIGYCCMGDDGYCAHDGDELGCLWNGEPIPGHDINTCAIACGNVPGNQCAGFDFLHQQNDGYWCCLYRTCNGESGESGRGYRLLTSSATPSLETDDSDESESAGSMTFGILFLFTTIAVVLF